MRNNTTCTVCNNCAASSNCGGLCWSCFCDKSEAEKYASRQALAQHEEDLAEEIRCVIEPNCICNGCMDCCTEVREEFDPID